MNLTQCSSPMARTAAGQRTILLVEDEPFVREATCSILSSVGFEVLAAEDADAALRVYEDAKNEIDLVISDSVLPGRSGEELCRDLRLRSPNLKVLITSGYVTDDSVSDQPGSQICFLAKPYSRRNLVEKIEKMFAAIPVYSIAGQAG